MFNKDNFFNLIKYEIKGETFSQDNNISREDLSQVFSLAKKHDIAHLVGDALIKNGLFKEDEENLKKKFEAEKFKAVYRTTQIEAITEIVKETFNDEKIKFIPLKGSVIRKIYPEPWMRTSCDIDVLINRNDLERAINCLEKRGFWVNYDRNYHDISLYYGNVHLELHFSICENMPKSDTVLKEVWNYSELYDGYEYRENREYFVFHHIAHMAYHVQAGGCGIRPFIDLWLMQNAGYYSDEKLKPFLEEGGLTQFYDKVNELIGVWFYGRERQGKISVFESFVLSGGVYGTSKNKVTMGVASSGSNKGNYILRSAFPRVDAMKMMYPVLKKCIILLPICYLHRIISKIFGKDNVRVKKRIKVAFNYRGESVDSASELLNYLGIKK